MNRTLKAEHLRAMQAVLATMTQAQIDVCQWMFGTAAWTKENMTQRLAENIELLETDFAGKPAPEFLFNKEFFLDPAFQNLFH